MATRSRRRRASTSPRKRPQQERSRATVEAILDAAADILARQGASRLTTNHVADRAGVNIASLYQYFPNKQAILAELRRRHGIEQRDAARRALAAGQTDDPLSTLRTLLEAGIAAHAVNPNLHRAFSEELPALRYAEIAAADRPLVDAFEAFLRESEPGRRDPELAMWLLAIVIDAVIHRAVVDRPDDVANGRMTRELVTLLSRYLDYPSGPSKVITVSRR
jgi:AcrR family transcriptional regulator